MLFCHHDFAKIVVFYNTATSDFTKDTCIYFKLCILVKTQKRNLTQKSSNPQNNSDTTQLCFLLCPLVFKPFLWYQHHYHLPKIKGKYQGHILLRQFLGH